MGSRAPRGSSSKRTSGSSIRALIRLMRCCCPPESWMGKLSSRSTGIWTRPASSLMRASTRASVHPSSFARSATLSRAERWGKRPPSCMTYPIRCRMDRIFPSCTASPSNVISPDEGWMSPFINRRRVDLPHPLGPMSTVVCPLGRTRLIGWRAIVEPYFLETLDR